MDYGLTNETIVVTFYLMDYRVHNDAKSIELSILCLSVWNCLFCILRGCRSKEISVPEVCFLIVKQCRTFMREIAFTYIREYMRRFIMVFNVINEVNVFSIKYRFSDISFKNT